MDNPQSANKFIFSLLLYQIFISVILNGLPKSEYSFVYFPLISLFIPIVIYFFSARQKISQVLLIKKISKKNLCLLILFAFSIQPVMEIFSMLSAIFAKNPTQNLTAILETKPLWLIIFSMAIMPAIFEETIFRGIILSGYRNVNRRLAFFLNGLIFAAIHLNFQQFLYAMMMGIIFSILVFYTQSIFSSILVHFIFNATQLIFAFYKLEFRNIFIFGMIFAPISFFLFRAIIKNCTIEMSENEEGEKILTLPLVLYFAFAFYIMYFN